MRTMKITLEQAKEKVLNNIISAEIGTYTTMYAPDKAVLSISNIMSLTGLTKYGARKAIKELIKDGMIYYTSQGCPELTDLDGKPLEPFYTPRPPINGYALTEKGHKSQAWQDACDEWCKSMEEGANGI